MPKTESKRRIGKKDLAIYSEGRAKEGGRLAKAGASLNVPKKSASKPMQMAEKPKAMKKEPNVMGYKVSLDERMRHLKDVDARPYTAENPSGKPKKKK